MIACVLAGSIAVSCIKAQATVLARHYGLRAQLVHAIIKVESDYQIDAVSHKGAVGLMQVMPKFHGPVPKDVYKNLKMGMRYLKYARDKCQPRYGDAWFVCYNFGPFTKLRAPKKTQYYQLVIRAIE